MQARYAIVVTLAFGVGTACNGGGFAAGGQRKAATKSAAQDKDDTLDAQGDNKKADGDDGLGDARPGSSADDGDDEGGKFPGTDGDGDTAKANIGGDFNKSLIDILGAAAKVADDVVVNQPNDNEIEFGGAKVFRLGDSKASQSSCLPGISAYTVAGKKYVFEFEVKKDDTQVAVEIGQMCGVDYGDTNFVSLAQGGSTVGTPVNIPRGSTSYSFPGATLKVGKYAFIVESRNGSNDTSFGPIDPNDYDDYIIGKVKIKANKQIRPGAVGAQ